MGNGQWAMGNGQWAMGNGQWAMGNGQWAMGNGQWAMGQWLFNLSFGRYTLYRFLGGIRHKLWVSGSQLPIRVVLYICIVTSYL
jgi:hypothetical protein